MDRVKKRSLRLSISAMTFALLLFDGLIFREPVFCYEENYPIDLWLRGEIARDCGNIGMANATAVAEEKWDAQRKMDYEELASLLGKAEKQLLEKTEMRWRSYYDGDALFFDVIPCYASNIWTVVFAGERLGIVRRRAIAMMEYLDFVKTFAKDGSAIAVISGDWDVDNVNIEELERELEQEVKQLSELLDRKSKKILRDAQKKWRAYYESELAFMNAMHKKGVLSESNVEAGKWVFVQGRIMKISFYREIVSGERY